MSSINTQENTKLNLKIGFIGAGGMALAMCKGFISSGLVDANDILGSCANMYPGRTFGGARVTGDNCAVVNCSDVIFLSVKPYQVQKVLDEVRPHIDIKRHLFVSVAAGVTIENLENWSPAGTRIARAMPNTPCMVRCGVTVCSPGNQVSAEDMSLVKSLFATIGICEVHPEKIIEPVIGVSGSGPAYIFMAIEALADGAVKMGMPRKTAIKFAAQTCKGAAQMVLETGEHPGVLKDNVCSPGGTTIAAVHSLEKNGLRNALISAVEASALKSRDLAK